MGKKQKKLIKKYYEVYQRPMFDLMPQELEGIDFNSYNKVLSGVIQIKPGKNKNYDYILETLFYYFNTWELDKLINKKVHRKYHSLSMGDVVKVDGKYYLCNYSGWKIIK